MSKHILLLVLAATVATPCAADVLVLQEGGNDLLNLCSQGGAVHSLGDFTFTSNMERQVTFTLHRPPQDDLPVICRGWRQSWACKRLLRDMQPVTVTCHLETDAATGAVEVIADRIHFEP